MWAPVGKNGGRKPLVSPRSLRGSESNDTQKTRKRTRYNGLWEIPSSQGYMTERCHSRNLEVLEEMLQPKHDNCIAYDSQNQILRSRLQMI